MTCIEEERKKAFVVFASTYEAAKHLTREQKGELFELLGAYSLEGKVVHSENPMIDIIVKMSMPNMDAAEKRHQAAIENGSKGKMHGDKGGRPRKGETREEYDARRLQRVKNLEDEVENPQKPLDIDNNTNKDIDKDINNDINKNTNVEVMSDSGIVNSCLEEDDTEYREEPRQEEKPQQHFGLDNSNLTGDETHQKAEPRQGQRPRQENKDDLNRRSVDFARSITLDDFDDEVPPCPPDSRYMNFVGSLQNLIRYDAEPDYDAMTDEEIMESLIDTIDKAIECEYHEGTSQRYQDLIQRAKKMYMHQFRCSADEAKKEITRRYRIREREMQN